MVALLGFRRLRRPVPTREGQREQDAEDTSNAVVGERDVEQPVA
ncbi:hypothetical protein ACIOMM_30650 [Streptomyces sp. NPDC087908]